MKFKMGKKMDIDIINSVVESNTEVEITEEMIRAGMDTIHDVMDGTIGRERFLAEEVYKVMERVRRFQEPQK
jgi:hypothetical protein